MDRILTFIEDDDEMGEAFPLAAYTQVFLPANLGVGPAPGAAATYGAAFFSEALLLGRRSGWEAAETHLAIAGALARQWFGVLLRPAGPEDAWLLEGLAEHMAWRVARALLGNQEAAWRRRQQADAVVAADTGALLPLAEAFHGAGRHLSPESARLHRWKAGYVVGMLERRMGLNGQNAPETFGRVIQCAAAARPQQRAPRPTLLSPGVAPRSRRRERMQAR